MEQETIYEAFLNCLINKEFKTKEDYIAFKGAEFGAKWQQEKSYSEEEVIKILYQFHYDLINSNIDTKEEWFEQFKNK